MTTKVTVSAHHGWPVKVTFIDPVSSDELRPPIVVLVGDTQDFHVHSGADIRVHEIQPEKK